MSVGYLFFRFRQGCLVNGCLNKGSCIFDQEKETFVCSCKQPWRGERCELGKRTRYAILFTARSLFVLHYHLEIYTAMAVFLYRGLSGYMFLYYNQFVAGPVN